MKLETEKGRQEENEWMKQRLEYEYERTEVKMLKILVCETCGLEEGICLSRHKL